MPSDHWHPGQVHRRKSSKDDDDLADVDHDHQPPRLHTRISLSSTPNGSTSHPNPLPPSISSPFIIPVLSTQSQPSPTKHAFPASPSSPQLSSPNPNGFLHPTPNRRHNRIHSRNLSVFFPRPDALPPSTIQEDGTENLQATEETIAPVTTIPNAGSSASVTSSDKQLGAGFRFGSLPQNSSGVSPSGSLRSAGGRRGHHHKHSLSHNFFSFLEPGSQHSVEHAELHTQPTPVPLSPWAPISPFPHSAAPEKTSFSLDQESIHGNLARKHDLSSTQPSRKSSSDMVTIAYAVGQFILGAWLWVIGQHITSLGCTGLGYWVVFDAMGVGVASILPRWLTIWESNSTRRFYGTARVETVCMFAQAVYLMFASVYVSKEAVEHFLLHAGNGNGHEHVGGGHGGVEGHHHHVPEGGFIGLEIPLYLVSLALLSIMGSALVYENHSKLANVANNRFSSISSLIHSIISPRRSYAHLPDDGAPWGLVLDVLSNPYVVTPMSFCLAILSTGLVVEPAYHRFCDLILACLEAIITFRLAYKACVVLGAVLLQTSPPRGQSGGRMEAFLRVMKEVERHPKVLHLPAPHIWQVTPTLTHFASRSTRDSPDLVVTLELHVPLDLDDEEVMKLTRWTWEKCVTALVDVGNENGRLKDVSGVDVSVGVVRG